MMHMPPSYLRLDELLLRERGDLLLVELDQCGQLLQLGLQMGTVAADSGIWSDKP